MLADYHVHTKFSDDSEYSMEECIERYISLNFDEICFTDHVDYGMRPEQVCDAASLRREFLRCRDLYADKIKLKFGMEFGAQIGTVDEYEKLFRAYPFDFIILSCHQVDNMEFWNYEFQAGKSQAEYNEAYYREILRVMQSFDNYSVLGHLDSIKRYDKFGEYPFDNVRPLIAEILQTAIARSKGLEVNTSCYRYHLSDLTPCREILSLYRELGGEILTFGSDSHEEGHTGYKIAETRAEVKKLGFKHFYTFDMMHPIRWEL